MTALFTTSTALPLLLLGIVWFRYTGIELRYLFLPQYAEAHSARLEHMVITSQTTGRAHDSFHVPHEPDSHSEPEEMQVSWLTRALVRTAARGPVVSETRDKRTPSLWLAQREPHYRS